MSGEVSFDCVLAAWSAHEREVLDFLAHRIGERATAEDLLQEVFLKAMRQGKGFCELDNPRAWLFQVARNAMTDHFRRSRPHTALPETLPAAAPEERAPVDELDVCVARNLVYLTEADRAVIEACDLQSLTVSAFAEREGLSLAAAKSRLLRARERLRASLVRHCQVRFDSGTVCCHKPPPEGSH
ncbi:sigma-70 family RNA polymerase sigma factor [Mangrovitalea sediminis]|uniref:sigma-70 family RNA polymerase sigma factor n=1 Tax=Mangrovitalea sediminis TaxID=1982043 RepID=UPI001D0D0172|nr:sigma-70 family RNA polymerase sigma factor [Mangrovitalea sediminis]